MAHHSRYWSNSALADWLRGTDKLKVGTSEEWDEWRTTAKMRHNFRYWLAEDALDAVQDFVTCPVRKIYDIKYYINNRWVTGTHALTAHPRDIKPGTWRDVGDRFLPCLFNELVDFVEIELAWQTVAWSDKAAREKYAAPFWAWGWFRWRTWRSAQAGLDNLEWQRNLKMDENYCVEPDSKDFNKPTAQAIAAQEILDLYTWWTTVYPNRPDPHEASGWSAVCDEYRAANGGGVMGMFRENNNRELARRKDRAHKLLQKIERQYEREDDQMLARLVKIRRHLWT
jgi:hypothetical protein